EGRDSRVDHTAHRLLVGDVDTERHHRGAACFQVEQIANVAGDPVVAVTKLRPLVTRRQRSAGGQDEPASVCRGQVPGQNEPDITQTAGDEGNVPGADQGPVRVRLRQRVGFVAPQPGFAVADQYRSFVGLRDGGQRLVEIFDPGDVDVPGGEGGVFLGDAGREPNQGAVFGVAQV